MAPLTTPITKEDWKRHGDTVHDLYHVQGLRLYGKGNEKSVQKIMLDDHGFYASVSQYEAYLKGCDQPKKLKKTEWRAVDAKLRQLRAKGLQTQVKVSGQIRTKMQVERSIRHAHSGSKRQNCNSGSSNLELPPPHRVAIEIRKTEQDNWLPYTNEDIAIIKHTSAAANSNVGSDFMVSSVPEPVHENENSFINMLDALSDPSQIVINAPILNNSLAQRYICENPELSTTSLGITPFLHPRCPSPWPSFGSPSPSQINPLLLTDFESEPPWGFIGCSPSGSMVSELSGVSHASSSDIFDQEVTSTPQDWANMRSAVLQYRTAVSDISTQNLNSQYLTLNSTGVGHGWDAALISISRPFVQFLLQDATQISVHYSNQSGFYQPLILPDPEELMESLISALPERMASFSSGQAAELTTGRDGVGSPLYNALLRSVANGFAGLQNIPPAAVLRTLMKDRHITSRISDCLHSYPPGLAKALADNLFRVAVEACVEPVARFILQSTRDTANAIDPNKFVCALGNGRLYTPVELAARLRDLGMVQLLAPITDVNKTYTMDSHEEHGALACAIRFWGEHEPIDVQLIQALLECGAKVQAVVIDAAVRWGQKDIISVLISYAPLANHHHYFNSQMFETISGFLENEFATKMIKKFFKICWTANCRRCAVQYKITIDRAFHNATRRGNVELVRFLLPYTTSKDIGLSAAIKSGRRELIDLMLQHGARVSAPPHRRFIADRHPHDPAGSTLTTPLAEAIRLQDKDLVRELEMLGAINSLQDEGHLEAAMIAAAEVDDSHYLQMLLKHVPEQPNKPSQNPLSEVLYVAVYHNRTNAVRTLMDHGAEFNDDRYIGFHPLVKALENHNKVLVDAILDTDIYLTWEDTAEAMEAAVLWGDMLIIEDLVTTGCSLHADCCTEAMAAAVESRNKAAVELLFKIGMPYKHLDMVTGETSNAFSMSRTILTSAVSSGDDVMVRFVLSKGADPASFDAFHVAIENKQHQALNLLLENFSARYPHGKVGFGGGLLQEAITNDDGSLLNRMLAAKFDVNSFGPNFQTAFGFAINNRMRRDSCLVRRLINAGGDVNGFVHKGRDHLYLETALLVAIRTGSEEIVGILLEYGADIHRPARRGVKRTPLQLACEIGNFKIVKLLLDNGAVINETPTERSRGSALYFAAASGSIKIANFLLAKGASIHPPPGTVKGRSALDGAAAHGRLEMINLLWNEAHGKLEPYTYEQMGMAISLARKNAQRGCVELLVGLRSGVNSTNLLSRVN